MTEGDFWRMILQKRTKLIVLLDDLSGKSCQKKARMEDCPFWAITADKSFVNGAIRVQLDSFRSGPDYDAFSLIVQHRDARRGHEVLLLEYHEWEDADRVPKTLTKFVSKVRLTEEQQSAQTRNRTAQTPVVVVCRTVSSSQSFSVSSRQSSISGSDSMRNFRRFGRLLTSSSERTASGNLRDSSNPASTAIRHCPQIRPLSVPVRHCDGLCVGTRIVARRTGGSRTVARSFVAAASST